MTDNIALVGFMGTGKTSTAKALAALCGLKYVSTDDLIEKKEGRSIRDIFDTEGEEYFRSLEKAAVKDLSLLSEVVIDTGGGAILFQENWDNLKSNCRVYCLRAGTDTILNRVKGSSDRPLLNVADPRAKIEELLKRREPYYAKADYFVDTDGKSPEEVADDICKMIRSGHGEKE